MKRESVCDVVERHFEFENPEQINRVIETFSDDIVWEAPARNLYLTNHDEIVAQYRKIIAGVIAPDMEVLHRFARGDEFFDDRILHFTAAKGNVWGIEPGKKASLRLAHYFKVKNEAN